MALGTALVTPFTNDGVNYKELKNLLDFQIQQGSDAVIVCGTTGEGSTMSLEEKKQVIKFTIENVHNQIPVIAGTGSNNTKDAIALSKYAKEVRSIGLTYCYTILQQNNSKWVNCSL